MIIGYILYLVINTSYTMIAYRSELNMNKYKDESTLISPSQL